jgi:hypothetical protein
MTTVRAVLLGTLTLLTAATADAQKPSAGPATPAAEFGGQAATVGPRLQHPTPLFVTGGLAVGIWTRVPPPYDVTANRNAVENPLP